MSPLCRPTRQIQAKQTSRGQKARRETTLHSLRGGAFERQSDSAPVACHADPELNGVVRKNVWQVLSQRPSRLAQGWRYGKKL